jgi:imidazolonepropionase-like amidohydrolase
MRILLGLLLIVLAQAPLVAQTNDGPQPQPLVITHVTVIDATGTPAKPDMTVVVIGDRISKLGKSSKVRVPADAQIVDATGKYLIPGLWDMHVHTFRNASKRPPQTWYFPLFIANGITGVRDMWTKVDSMPQVQLWRKQFAEKPGTVPRFGAVGTQVDGVPPHWPNADTVSTADEARRMVDRLKAGGVDFVKVYWQLSREAYFAIVDEAKKQRIPFAGHVPFSISALEASDAGQKSIEHLDGISLACSSEEERLSKLKPEDLPPGNYFHQIFDTYDEKKCARLFAHFAINGTWQVPTLYMPMRTDRGSSSLLDDDRLKYVPIAEREEWKAFIARLEKQTPEQKGLRRMEMNFKLISGMRRSGVRFMAGTDLGNEYVYPGFSLHDELVLLVQAGLTPMEAIQSATRNPATFIGKLDSLGTIEKGKFADLVLLEANPLEDISNTQRINAVVVNGRYLPKEALQRMLAEAVAAANKVIPR